MPDARYSIWNVGGSAKFNLARDHTKWSGIRVVCRVEDENTEKRLKKHRKTSQVCQVHFQLGNGNTASTLGVAKFIQVCQVFRRLAMENKKSKISLGELNPQKLGKLG